METPKNVFVLLKPFASQTFRRCLLLGLLLCLLPVLTGCTSWPWQEKPQEQRPRTVTEWMGQSERPEI